VILTPEMRQITSALVAQVEAFAAQRAGDFVDELLAKFRGGAPVPRAAGGRRSPPARLGARARAARRKGPIQLCPVPGCKNRAAPVFGMVCAGHKDVPRTKIAAYREARRASKAA
jgi:hypothetical protein